MQKAYFWRANLTIYGKPETCYPPIPNYLILTVPPDTFDVAGADRTDRYCERQ